jgi:hypothetical protein
MPGIPSTWVEFPGYRQYESTRQDANNAMMALLAGSKLAAHTLQLTTGSHQLLPAIFPGVEHIRYFNLRTDDATELLLDTGHHLGAVAVPYALAVHEDFVLTTLKLLQKLGYTQKAPGDSNDLTKNRVTAWNMHEAIYLTLGEPVPSRGSNEWALEHFHLLREMRNSQIHNGRVTSVRLQQEVADMSSLAETEWIRLSRRPSVDLIASGTFRYTIFDIFTAFATTKSLGRMLNTLLLDSLTASEWAQVCIEDYASQSSKPLHSDQWMRGLIGYASQFYSKVSLTEQQIVDAAVLSRLWAQGATFRQRSGRSRSRDRGTLYPGAQ